MFKCTECGRVFEEPAEWEESRGEYWGVPCTETMYGCPYCGGYFEEAKECEECGEWRLREELTDGLCECCQKKGNKDNDYF